MTVAVWESETGKQYPVLLQTEKVAKELQQLHCDIANITRSKKLSPEFKKALNRLQKALDNAYIHVGNETWDCLRADLYTP